MAARVSKLWVGYERASVHLGPSAVRGVGCLVCAAALAPLGPGQFAMITHSLAAVASAPGCLGRQVFGCGVPIHIALKGELMCLADVAVQDCVVAHEEEVGVVCSVDNVVDKGETGGVDNLRHLETRWTV